MLKAMIICMVLVFSATPSLAVDYSRDAAKLVASTYLAGQNGVSTQAIRSSIDEIIVNDQRGTQCYDVEIVFKADSVYKSGVLTLSQLDVVSNCDEAKKSD